MLLSWPVFLLLKTIFCLFALVLQLFSNYLNILLAQFFYLVCWIGTLDWRLFSLTACLGGLGLFDPTAIAAQEHSHRINSCLMNLIVSQTHLLSDCAVSLGL